MKRFARHLHQLAKNKGVFQSEGSRIWIETRLVLNLTVGVYREVLMSPMHLNFGDIQISMAGVVNDIERCCARAIVKFLQNTPQQTFIFSLFGGNAAALNMKNLARVIELLPKEFR